MKKTKKGNIFERRISVISFVFSALALLVSIASLGISYMGYILDQDSKPLAYRLEPKITDRENGSMFVDIEVIVTNGAIGDIKVFDYRDGEIYNITDNRDGTIRKSSKGEERTITFQVSYEFGDRFIATQYVLIHGKDGSRHLGMILYDIDPASAKEPQVDFYSQEDLLFASMDPNQTIYGNAISQFQALVTVLKESGEF